MNFASISKIKSRLINIIDSILIKYDPSQANLYALDQSKLQDFVYIISDSIISKQQYITPVNKNTIKSPTQKQYKISLPTPQQNNLQKPQQFTIFTKIVHIIDSCKLIVYSMPEQKRIKLRQPIDKIIERRQYQFGRETLKRFCSVCQISENKIIFTGGCYYSNPMQKTSSISLFQTQTGVISKIGQMLDSLSSHATVLLRNRVYIIGGKKNQGIITKMCSYFDLQTKQTVQIAALNYAAASLSALTWKNNSIYKIGGIGNCFGQWNISPYIEKYYIDDDTWQVINPFISQNSLQKFNQFQLYAHSIAYVSNRDELVVFGGFGVDKKGTNFGCIIEIKSASDGGMDKDEYEFGNEDEEVHQIKQFGVIDGLQPGGFWTTQLLNKRDQKGQLNIIALETILAPNLTFKLVNIPTKE